MFINSIKPNSHLIIRSACLGAVFAACSMNANATEFQFSGFANIGLTYSDSDVLGYRSSLQNDGYEDLSFKPDSLIGLQSNIKFSSKLDAVAQFVLQDRDNKDYENFLELAFLRYQINRNWALKAGRFSTQSYLYTDYRFVGHLLTWVRPPLEMYSTAGSLGNMDGVNLSYVMDVDWGAIKYSAAYGQANYKDGNNEQLLSVDYTDLTSLNVELQATDWRFQLAYLTAVTDNLENNDIDIARLIVEQVPPIFVPYANELLYNFIPDGRRVTYVSAGGHYSFEHVDVIAEISHFDSDWSLADGSTNGYVTLAYPADEFTPFMTLAFYERERYPDAIDYESASAELPPVLFAQLQALTAGFDTAAKGTSVDQSSLSLGVKWDFHPSWSVKGQFDYFKINEFGSGFFSVAEGSLTPSDKISYRVFSVNFTTTF